MDISNVVDLFIIQKVSKVEKSIATSLRGDTRLTFLVATEFVFEATLK